MGFDINAQANNASLSHLASYLYSQLEISVLPDHYSDLRQDSMAFRSTMSFLIAEALLYDNLTAFASQILLWYP